MNYKIKNIGAFILLCFYTISSSAQIKYINNIEDLNTGAKRWGNSLLDIALYVGAIAAVLSLVKVFKGIEKGDEQVAKVAGGWFAAVSVFIIGMWFVKEYVIRN